MFGPKHTFRSVVERLVAGLEDGSLYLPQEQLPLAQARGTDVGGLNGEEHLSPHSEKPFSAETLQNIERIRMLSAAELDELLSTKKDIKELAHRQPEVFFLIGEVMGRHMEGALQVAFDKVILEAPEAASDEVPDTLRDRLPESVKKKIHEAARGAVLAGLQGFLKDVGLDDPQDATTQAKSG
jgi:hypothetical protein